MPVYGDLFKRLASTSPAMSLFQPNPNLQDFPIRTSQDIDPGFNARDTGPDVDPGFNVRSNMPNPDPGMDAARGEWMSRPKSPIPGAMSEKPPQGLSQSVPMIPPDAATGQRAQRVIDFVKAQSEKQNDPNHQLRYEDIAPHLEEIPQTPVFQGKEHYGVMDRIKMALAGLGMGAMQQQGQNPYKQGGGMLGGALAGIFNPKGVQETGFNQFQLPQAAAKQKGVIDRNNARLQAFDRELKARQAIAKINEGNSPKWRQGTGAQYPYLYDEKTGDYHGIMNDGEPVEAASVVAARGHDTTSRMNTKAKIKAADEQTDKKHEYKVAEIGVGIEGRKAISAAAQAAAERRVRIQEAGRDRRQGIHESGMNKRQGIAIDAKENSGISGKGGNAGPARPGGGASNGTGPEGQSESFIDKMSPAQKKRWESIKKLRGELGGSSPDKTKL